jgi:hypothetical protein
MTLKASLMLISLMSFALPATAQPAAASSPEALVKEYMSVLNTEGMSAVARYLHPDELKRFKDMLMPWVRMDASQKSEALHGLFGADATLAQVEAMPAERFMDAFMRLAGDQLKDVTFGEIEIVGTVREKDVIHVVTRVAAGVKELRVNQLTVVSTKPLGKEWKLMLTGELEGLAAAIGAQH